LELGVVSAPPTQEQERERLGEWLKEGEKERERARERTMTLTHFSLLLSLSCVVWLTACAWIFSTIRAGVSIALLLISQLNCEERERERETGDFSFFSFFLSFFLRLLEDAPDLTRASSVASERERE